MNSKGTESREIRIKETITALKETQKKRNRDWKWLKGIEKYSKWKRIQMELKNAQKGL